MATNALRKGIGFGLKHAAYLAIAFIFVLVADVSINFLLFAPIFMITQGGPADSTNVLMYEAFKSGFIFGDMGRAMAIIVVVVAILLVIVGLQFRLLNGKPEKK